MAGRLEASGRVPRWDAWDLHGFPPVAGQMNARVERYQKLTTNLTKLLRAVYNLDQNEGPLELHRNRGPLNGDNLTLATRLTSIILYFYGAMSQYSQWISAQNVTNSAAARNTQAWIDFVQSLKNLFELLTSLPIAWYTNNVIVDDITADQTIPAEAPLELAVQICLNVRDAVEALDTPQKVQDHLRRFAEGNIFPGYNTPFDEDNHDGFSNCIFVSQSAAPNRNLVAGSTVLFLGHVNAAANCVNPNTNRPEDFTIWFAQLRQLRFTQNGRGYDVELRLRFRNEPDTRPTKPSNRFLLAGWQRSHLGDVLPTYVQRVIDRLTAEYKGQRGAPGAQNQPDGPLLPAAQQRTWVPFSYLGQVARSNFAPKTFPAQQTWFEPTPRCMKCRVIHDYHIDGEQLVAVKANANDSCQCAEDILYGKLRELGRVGNLQLTPVIS